MTAAEPGRTYSDRTPVPRPAERCPTTVTDEREGAPHSTLTHPCKLTAGHADDHRCICGKTWPPLVGARGESL